jgi:hypothetical protein
MKTKLIIFIFSLSYCLTSAQVATIDTLVIQINNISGKIESLYYPIIKTNSSIIDSAINQSIKDEFTNYEFHTERIDSSLIKYSRDGLVDLDFKVCLNENYILSFEILAEACGAYCTNWKQYFNYSLKTGNQLSLDSVFNLTDSLKNQIKTSLKKQYEDNKLELKEQFTKNGILDSTDFMWPMSYYESCYEEFNFNKFLIYPDGFEIKLDCYLPHVIVPLTPIFNFRYKKEKITPFYNSRK